MAQAEDETTAATTPGWGPLTGLLGLLDLLGLRRRHDRSVGDSGPAGYGTTPSTTTLRFGPTTHISRGALRIVLTVSALRRDSVEGFGPGNRGAGDAKIRTAASLSSRQSPRASWHVTDACVTHPRANAGWAAGRNAMT
jgi:hypothetical protein